MAVLINPTIKKCVSLSGNNPTQNARFNVEDPDNNDGLQIIFNGGDPNYGLTADIACSGDDKTIFADSKLNLANQANIIASFKSSVGCKND